MDKNIIVSTDEHELLDGIDPNKGFSGDYVSNKPVLLFQGIANDVLTDGFLMILGHGAREYLTNYAKSRKGVTDIKRGMGYKKREDAEEFIERELKNPTGTFPKYENLIPVRESWTGELTPVGAEDEPPSEDKDITRFVYLTDGDRVMGVSADNYAFIRRMLPTAKVFGQRESELYFPDETAESLGKSAYMYLDRLSPHSPLTFVVDGKAAGVLMPIFTKDIPEAIKQKAATLPITTKPTAHGKPKAHTSGTINIDSQGGAVELISYTSRADSRGDAKVYDGSKSGYAGQGDYYINIISKDAPDHIMAWNDKSKSARRSVHSA
jgi:hypothetical protein